MSSCLLNLEILNMTFNPNCSLSDSQFEGISQHSQFEKVSDNKIEGSKFSTKVTKICKHENFT